MTQLQESVLSPFGNQESSEKLVVQPLKEVLVLRLPVTSQERDGPRSQSLIKLGLAAHPIKWPKGGGLFPVLLQKCLLRVW